MDGQREKLEEAVLALPADARAELAHRLIASLDEGADADVEVAAQAEALRRSEEVDRGAVEPVPADELFRRVRARLSR